MAEVVRVLGYREFLRATDRAGRSVKREVRNAYKPVGEIVRADAAEKFSGFSEKSAAGFKVSVRQSGVSVRQSLRKTTGTNPGWGALQMTRALLPARAEKREEVEREFEKAIDRVADIFER